jgi:riboflavin kinase/FMN adenylyltransferase
MRVEFLHKIRDEERYADLDTLKAQIERDCEAARTFLLESRNV